TKCQYGSAANVKVNVESFRFPVIKAVEFRKTFDGYLIAIHGKFRFGTGTNHLFRRNTVDLFCNRANEFNTTACYYKSFKTILPQIMQQFNLWFKKALAAQFFEVSISTLFKPVF